MRKAIEEAIVMWAFPAGFGLGAYYAAPDMWWRVALVLWFVSYGGIQYWRGAHRHA